MRVLVLGGTGTIGGAVVPALRGRGHEVLALARSEASASRLAAAGAMPVRGDICAPEAWSGHLAKADAVVHAAATFEDDMAATDRRLVEALLAGMRPGARLIYTGGCWLFGATGHRAAADETAAFDPPPDFAWMVEAAHRVLAAPGVDAIVVHPAMVFARDAGVFARFAEEARSGGPIRVVGSEAVRWPLVHRDDLAQLYVLALEKGRPSDSYNGTAIEGLAVGEIARAIARRHGNSEVPSVISVAEIVAELGGWAAGYGLDQRMSGAKARRDLGWAPRHLDRSANGCRVALCGHSSCSAPVTASTSGLPVSP